jgi:excisionase family DNA binding protein
VEEFFSLRDIAGRLKVSEQTVRRWVKSGQLKAYKPGLEYRILASDLEEFLESRSSKAQAPSPPELTEEERRELVESVVEFLGWRPPDVEQHPEAYRDAMLKVANDVAQQTALERVERHRRLVDDPDQALRRVEQNRRLVDDPDQALRRAERGLSGEDPSAEDDQKATGA